MIRTISVKNYKSIENLNISLGRVNVFIGENGAGKSNILESIALAGAAAADKVDSEFLASRGIRATDTHLMRCAFDEKQIEKKISIEISSEIDWSVQYLLENDGAPYSKWSAQVNYLMKSGESNFKKEYDELNFLKKIISNAVSKNSQKPNKILFEKEVLQILENLLDVNANISAKQKSKSKAKDETEAHFNKIKNAYNTEKKRKNLINEFLSSFLIYSPENSALRDFSKEGQVQPLGISGEGLFKLLKIEKNDPSFTADLIEFLEFFGWFEDLEIPDDASNISHIKAKDKYINCNEIKLDLRSTNEGFLFLAFYFALFRSTLTPDFFAIDNIDASLNPKLCKQIIKKISYLSEKYNKQVILTTHNPAILDGLDLNDSEQRLFVISRNDDGRTSTRLIEKPASPIPGRTPRLSTMFMDGALGGLPKSF